MTPEDFDAVVALARDGAGLDLRPDRAFFAESRLAPVARRQGLASVEALVAAARDGADPAVRRSVVEALASGETSFFRDRAVFDRLADEVLPVLAARRGPGRPLRIWSAGCATGQEVYSLALMALSRPDVPLVELFASDLSERSLQKARTGLFSHFEVQRGLPIRMLLAHFEKTEDMWRASSRLRQGIRWAHVNLAQDLSRLGPFDVVLCRNVLSGFTREAQGATLERLDRVVAPDGCLITGATERLILPAAFAGHGGVFLRNPAYRRDAA